MPSLRCYSSKYEYRSDYSRNLRRQHKALDATRKLRADSRFVDLPIIAVTAHAVSGEAEAILASGVNEMITKPIDDDLLSARLKHWLPLDG